ncbi:hypothetical protein PIB30_056119 [Stylosanthes scabra]|uniref:GRF-type domain-containing protein n=1 Tax=Stylosanthes scabra TaxID=79078 RepID=A0ABU6QJ43_9FABA|nr:hypothetical protein [Stylosanthes scabra]
MGPAQCSPLLLLPFTAATIWKYQVALHPFGLLETGGGSSASRRSSGGAGGERSSSSTQGFVAAKVGNERDGVAPTCDCNVYAVLYLSKTVNNPDRLFFGCPFFKIKKNHCKFFLWLDEHAAKFGRVAGAPAVKESRDDVDVHFFRMNIETRLSEPEGKISSFEKKGSNKWGLIFVWLVVVVIGVFVGTCK